MQIGIMGANFKTANISLREKINQACLEFQPSLINDLTSYVLLSTCNRSEIYFCGENLTGIHEQLLEYFRKKIENEFEPYLYSYFGIEAFYHLAKITSGLDSAVIGESEIQGQVKRAYIEYAQEFHLSSSMHYVFQKALKIGKTMRTQSLLFPKAHSLSSEVDRLIEILCPGKNKSIFFLGNSKINQNFFSFFQRKGFRSFALCSRYNSTTPFNGSLTIIPWKMREKWQEFDIVIAAARDANCAIRKSNVYRPTTKLLFDLAMPRNIDPSLEKSANIHLFNLEHLEKFSEHYYRRYQNNVKVCESEIKNLVIRYITNYQSKKHWPLQLVNFKS